MFIHFLYFALVIDWFHEIEKKTMQYLYNDGGLYYFMDNETYDQMPLHEEQLGDCLKYLN